jgi:hypothetical protein
MVKVVSEVRERSGAPVERAEEVEWRVLMWRSIWTAE